MKVVGTGTPQVAQVCFDACEVETLRAELGQLYGTLLEAQEPAPRVANPRPCDARAERERLIAREAIERFLDVTTEIPADQPVRLEGPFELMRALVWSGLQRVAVGLQRAVDNGGMTNVGSVVQAARTAQAWAQTVADLDYVENHGLGEGCVAGAWHVGE